MRFIFACGGTAGHINPALAIANKLNELVPQSEFLFIGAQGKMEMELVPKSGYNIKALKITGMRRELSISGLVHNIDSVKNTLTSLAEAKRIIKAFKPDAVIGTGGYVCYPVLAAAHELNIPSFVHESNAVPGLTTKMLSGRVDHIMLGFEESKEYYKHTERISVTGTPVRGEFDCYTNIAAKQELGIPSDMPLVLSMWGSLGSLHMNTIMSDMIAMLDGKQGFYLIHSTGSARYDKMIEKLNTTAPNFEQKNVRLQKYIYDVPRYMAAADLVLSRAGASTISELTYMGKPVIMVPSPNVTNNHQEKNARVLEKAGGAKVMLEGEFDSQGLLDEVKMLLANPQELASMSKAMRSLAVSDSTDRICSIILEHSGPNKKNG